MITILLAMTLLLALGVYNHLCYTGAMKLYRKQDEALKMIQEELDTLTPDRLQAFLEWSESKYALIRKSWAYGYWKLDKLTKAEEKELLRHLTTEI